MGEILIKVYICNIGVPKGFILGLLLFRPKQTSSKLMKWSEWSEADIQMYADDTITYGNKIANKWLTK